MAVQPPMCVPLRFHQPDDAGLMDLDTGIAQVVLDQNLPILPAAMQAANHAFAPVLNLHACTAPTKRVGASINRVRQDVVESAVHWRLPLD